MTNLGIEAPGRPGARSAHTGRMQAPSNTARRDASVARLVMLFLSGSLAAASTVGVLGTPAPEQQPTFRSTVDVIAVDVQVVDGNGDPVDRLGPEAFAVSIKGKRRKVVSADFVRHASADGVASGAGPSGAVTASQAARSAGDRTLILAFDNGTFDVGSERAPVDAMRAFLDHVGASDRVGLAVFPLGMWIPPMTDRAPLRVGFGRIVGQKQPLHGAYNLRPWEIVDITAQSTNPHSFLAGGRAQPAVLPADIAAVMDPVLRVQRRECPGEPECPSRIYAEGMGLATQIEHEVQESLAGLELLLKRLAAIPGRKSVVLVSAGVLVSDRLDGRPDVGRMAEVMGQTAARANATVYTIHFDPISQAAAGAASQRGTGSSELMRDRALLSHWLDEFSNGAGGKRLYVPTGQGDFAFDRVLRESSAYYLLGVEPDDADRDGQPRKLEVKVARPGLTVRSRQWVLVPAKQL